MTKEEIERIGRLMASKAVPTDHRLMMGHDGIPFCVTCMDTYCRLRGDRKATATGPA
jgi:hypothetical protein